MAHPTVDILMATYNGEHYVAEQIESIQAQTYQDWHLLVSDDCSTDGTLDVVQSYAAKDSRISVVSKGVRYGGAKQNFMALFAESDAPYAMFCDQDDIWLSEKVEHTLGKMRDLEDMTEAGLPLLVFADMRVVDENLNTISESFEDLQGLIPSRTSLPQCLAQAIGAGCTFLMNRSLAEVVRRCDDIDAMIMHDWWVAIGAAAFGQIGYVDEPLSLYRQHGDNTVGASRFSVGAWAGRLDEMKGRERAVAEQAGCFLETFCTELDSDQKVVCACLAGSMGESGARNIARLFLSGAWKAGARKFGQLLVSVRGLS